MAYCVVSVIILYPNNTYKQVTIPFSEIKNELPPIEMDTLSNHEIVISHEYRRLVEKVMSKRIDNRINGAKIIFDYIGYAYP